MSNASEGLCGNESFVSSRISSAGSVRPTRAVSRNSFAPMTALTLTPEELQDFTGVMHKQRQLDGLHAQGFIGARLPDSRVIAQAKRSHS